MHELFNAADVRQLRENHPGVTILAHPECPPEVVAEADFSGSTAAMSGFVGRERPARVVLLTECSMSDNVAVLHPDVEFIRPCNLCPHMKRITLKNIRHALETNDARGDDRSRDRRSRASDGGKDAGAMSTDISALAGRPVIIGGGAAGLMTALQLVPQPVVLLSKSPLGAEASSLWAQGGLGGCDGRGMTTLPCIWRTPSPPARACATSPSRAGSSRRHRLPSSILHRLGVAFDRRPDGGWRLGLEAAHSRNRIVHATGDGTGREIMRALIAAVRLCPSVTLLEGSEARRLIVEDNAVRGVLAAGERGAAVIATDRVVIATGGIGGLFLDSTNPAGCFGQGIALAAHAGAKLSDLEFIQFHPTAFDGPSRPMPLLTEAIRGDGAILIDETGQRFMADISGAELAPRDVVARAVWRRRARRPSRLPRRAKRIRARILRSATPSSAHSAGWPGSIRRPSDPGTARGALSHGRHCRGQRRPQHRRADCGPAARSAAPGCMARTGSPATR